MIYSFEITKKGNLSLQVIVIAAIVLLVLIILTVIFTGRMAGWSTGLQHCDTVCKLKSKACVDEGYDELPIFMESCKDDQGNSYSKPAYCCKEKP